MKNYLLLSFSVLALLGASHASQAQCTFTSTTTGGNFRSPSTWTRSGNCGNSTIPQGNDQIIINGPVVLNGNFSLNGNGQNPGTITINSGGSLIEDATRRTLTLGATSGSQTDRLTVGTNARLVVSQLTATKSQLNVASGGTVTVQCNLTLNNLGKAAINGAVTLNGNLNLVTGNAQLSGNGSMLIIGCVTGTNGSLQQVVQGALKVCVRNRPTTCGTGTCNGDIPVNNDINCAIIDPPGVLPVELTSFKAGAAGNCACVRLAWQTASEHDSKEFLIERSADGREFGAIGQVPALGTSTSVYDYNWRDERPLIGQCFYRLRQVDQDGSFSYSAVVSVQSATAPTALTLWPATTGLYEVGPLGAAATLTVLTPEGRTVLTKGFTDAGGQLNLRGLPAGLYLVRAASALGIQTTRIAHRND